MSELHWGMRKKAMPMWRELSRRCLFTGGGTSHPPLNEALMLVT